ncbi:hypothetical protein HZS_1746 [Henneguya salminicola]|nr:hypothetical protein HZS_1746 [Henneguya salminicola]
MLSSTTSLNCSNLNESTESTNRSGSSKTKNFIHLSSEVAMNLSNDALTLHLKSSITNLQSCQQNMWRLLEERRLILSEFTRQYYLYARFNSFKQRISQDINRKLRE